MNNYCKTIVKMFVLEMFLIIIDIPTEEWMGQSDPTEAWFKTPFANYDVGSCAINMNTISMSWWMVQLSIVLIWKLLFPISFHFGVVSAKKHPQHAATINLFTGLLPSTSFFGLNFLLFLAWFCSREVATCIFLTPKWLVTFLYSFFLSWEKPSRC